MKKLSIMASLVLGMLLVTSCDSDRDDNPTLQTPTQFVLNTPAFAGNIYDLDNTSDITLTCSQPNYGFPVATSYVVQASLNSDMSGFTEMSTISNSTRITVDANELAVALTNQALEAGKTEADFPLQQPAYLRLRAYINGVDSTEILSNIVTLSRVYTSFALPAVVAPEKLYICGNFNGWSWETALETVPAYGDPNTTWHMVYIDDSGIKFNVNPSWDGGEVGYNKLNSISGDLAGEIVDGGGNIASSNPGWYLMVINSSIVGRDIVYDVQFNKPEVWLMGTCTALADWSELEDGMKFDVPAAADAEFVSPVFVNSTSGDGGLRAYVKVPGFDWWKTEFMVFDGKIVYRGAGGDQDRIEGFAGQKLYLNFTKETGRVE